MIITKTPLRISFCGGGTDLAAFYERAGYGAVLSTSIDKFVYLAIHRYFENKFLLKYSTSELTETVEEIKHPLIRECLKLAEIDEPLEVTSFADIPSSGSGLGSSSAFSVGLLHACRAFRGRLSSKESLAAGACEVEIERLREPIGKQDQFAVAYGGLNLIRFNADGSTWIDPVILPKGLKAEMESRLLLFYTGTTRNASDILAEQRSRTRDNEETFQALLKIRDQAEQLRAELVAGHLDALGHLLHEGWQLKRQIASGITSPHLDSIYDRAIAAGAIGGKLLGAGGGGFFLFYCEANRQDAVRAAMGELREVRFGMENQGSRIIFVEES
jgi:D-glycero-alpha-D-manno-heptose-7-phosphate kinase